VEAETGTREKDWLKSSVYPRPISCALLIAGRDGLIRCQLEPPKDPREETIAGSGSWRRQDSERWSGRTKGEVKSGGFFS
jgi:hypothetical protein